MKMDQKVPLKMSGRIRFSEDHDILLLRQAVAINPWSRKAGEGYKIITRNLLYNPPFKGPLFPRTIRERLALLLEKYVMAAPDTENREAEDPSQKQILLKQCITLKDKATREVPDGQQMNTALLSQMFEEVGNHGGRDSTSSGGYTTVKQQVDDDFSGHGEDGAEERFGMKQNMEREGGDDMCLGDGAYGADDSTPMYEHRNAKRGGKRKKMRKRDLMMHLLDKELTREKERKEELEMRKMELQLAKERQEFDMKLRQREMEMREEREKKELEIRLDRERLDMEQRRREMELREERDKREMDLRRERHKLEMEQKKREIQLRDETERLAMEERKFYLLVLQKLNDIS